MKSRTFPGLSRTFSGKFKGLLYQIKHTILEKLHYSVYWFSNELHKICFWEKIKPPFMFSNIVTSNVLCPIVTSSSFWLLFAIKGEKCRPFQDFQGPQPKFKDFSGPRFFFSFFLPIPGLSRIFKDRGNPDITSGITSDHYLNPTRFNITLPYPPNLYKCLWSPSLKWDMIQSSVMVVVWCVTWSRGCNSD